jgi:hypothetical protein
MIGDILYTDQFLVFEIPSNQSSGGVIQGISYDGNNFLVGSNTSSSAEIVSIFIN